MSPTLLVLAIAAAIVLMALAAKLPSTRKET